tara:strand:+ start:2983 stop:3207 length:225 start_codon:yes stop_codon:yes gene_type:complete
MIRNIRHIQIKKIAYHPNLFKAILTYEAPRTKYDESDDIEYIKLKDLEKYEIKEINNKYIKKLEARNKIVENNI